MAKSLWKNVKREWNKLQDDILRENNRIANQKIKGDLTNVVSEFSIEIPFEIAFEGGKDFITRIQVSPDAAFVRETDGEVVKAYDLFTWLDKGTSVKNIKFIGSANKRESASRQGIDDDPRILASKKYNLPGIEARNWTVTIAEKYKNQYPRAIFMAIKNFLGGS